jgi:chemotaxis protein MotB
LPCIEPSLSFIPSTKSDGCDKKSLFISPDSLIFTAIDLESGAGRTYNSSVEIPYIDLMQMPGFLQSPNSQSFLPTTKRWALLLLMAVSLAACVPKKQLQAEVSAKRAAEEKAKRLDADLDIANQKIADLEAKVATLEKEVQDLAFKSKGCEEEAKSLKTENADLKKRNAELAAELDRITNSSMSEKQKLDAALKKKIDELDAREKSIAELLDKLEAREKAVADLQTQLDARSMADADMRKQLEDREKALKELQDRIAARDRAMEDLRNKLKNALTGYQDGDLSVEVRNGKVYIAISDKMLFKSGSAAVEKLGKEALAKVATVLNKYPDMDLIIEGHTDNVPIKTERFTDNWDLSVIRATSVVRILTNDYAMPAARVTPSGKGEFFPKASNDTPEGRSKNRRTEIIIAPKLDMIEEMLKTDQ